MQVYCQNRECYYAGDDGFCSHESICIGHGRRCECYAATEEVRKMVCPNGCDAGFATTGHVMQEWAVDAYGNFQEVLNDCLETTHDADFDNVWTCTKCGAKGIIKTERRLINQ